MVAVGLDTIRKLSGSAPIPVAKPPSLALPASPPLVPKPVPVQFVPPLPKPIESTPIPPLPKPVEVFVPKPVVVIEPAPTPPKPVEVFVPKPVVVIEPAKPVNVQPEVLKEVGLLDVIKKPVTKLTNYVVDQSIDRVAKKAVEKGVDRAQVDKSVSSLRNYIATDASFKKKMNEVYNVGTAAVTTAIVGLAAVGAGAAGVGAGVGGGAAGGGAAVAGGGGAGIAGALGAVGSAAAAVSKLGGAPSPGQQVEPENFYENNNAKTPTQESGGGTGVLLGLAAALLALK